MIRGRDVSHYQGDVDWAGLTASEGLDFGAAKCSEGTSFVDSYFRQNRSRIKAAGLRFISYHYATPSASSPRTQAAKHVALSDPQPGDALCLDLEKSSLTQSATNTWMRAYGDALRDLAPGITTIAYLGGYAANGSGQSAIDHFDRWWYPRYPGPSTWPTIYAPRVDLNTTGWKAPPAPHIWQFTPASKGMDANVSNLTIAQLFNTEASMPTAAEIVDELFARKMTNPLDPTGATLARFDTMFEQTFGQARSINLALPGLVDDIAQAVVDNLPPANTGGLTKQDVVDALTQVLVNGTGGTS
jgi:GH25 family lysozyme M1 (1,4-beta-N-acetylmuramidase)